MGTAFWTRTRGSHGSTFFVGRINKLADRVRALLAADGDVPLAPQPEPVPVPAPFEQIQHVFAAHGLQILDAGAGIDDVMHDLGLPPLQPVPMDADPFAALEPLSNAPSRAEDVAPPSGTMPVQRAIALRLPVAMSLNSPCASPSPNSPLPDSPSPRSPPSGSPAPNKPPPDETPASVSPRNA